MKFKKIRISSIILIISSILLLISSNPMYFYNKLKLISSTHDTNTYYLKNNNHVRIVYGDSQLARFYGSVYEFAEKYNYTFITKEQYELEIKPHINTNCSENQLCEGDSIVINWTCNRCSSISGVKK